MKTALPAEPAPRQSAARQSAAAWLRAQHPVDVIRLVVVVAAIVAIIAAIVR